MISSVAMVVSKYVLTKYGMQFLGSAAFAASLVYQCLQAPGERLQLLLNVGIQFPGFLHRGAAPADGAE
jgi:hypothetical protein